MLNTITSLDHMDLHGLTPYEKLKGLLGGKTPKDFEVSNNLPLDKILNLDTTKM